MRTEWWSVLKKMQEDARLGPAHVSLYMAVVLMGVEQGAADGVAVRARMLMPPAKIGGLATYHRVMRQLNDYGYVRYVPSNDKRVGSRVWVKTEGDTGA